jgi:hypothetical protein
MAIPLLKYELNPGTSIVTIIDESNPNIDREESMTGYFTLEEVSPEAPLTEAEEEAFGGAQIFKVVDLFFQSESYQLTNTLLESGETNNILAADPCLTSCTKWSYLLSSLLVGTGFTRDSGEPIILDAPSHFTGDKQSPEKITADEPLLYTNSHQIGFFRNFSATRVDPPIPVVSVPEINGNGMGLGMGLLIALFALRREKYRPTVSA